MFSLKRETPKFKIDLDPELLKMIMKVKNEQRMIDCCICVANREKQLQTVQNERVLCGPEPSQPRVQHDVEADADYIRRGGDIDELEGSGQIRRHDTSVRQEKALERALAQDIEERRVTERELITEGCERIRPIAEKFELETIEAIETLVEIVKRNAAFYETLTKNGLRTGYRPAGMDVPQWLHRLIFGDNNFQSAEFFIDLRRKMWKFKD
ncbi:MAG: hypothetical protein HQ515_02905 [Phycisphaeraceae bacterium]|nr:hypothetical protein [Phycisphaeraceae bacterium]